jgi:hypothetical protein
MPSANAISLTQDVKQWLVNSRQPSILHIFDPVCNLMNERREVLSIVTPQIGNGPFNLVLADDMHFSDTLNLESSIIISADHFTLGALSINMASARSWNPRPDWERLRAERARLSDQLSQLQGAHDPREGFLTASVKHTDLRSLLADLAAALAHADRSSARKIASRLAGLGTGLTPAGDDVLMGAMYAVWIIHTPEVGSVLLQEIVNAAAPLTTSLSGAWLRAAGKGEAGILWHECFHALLSEDPAQVWASLESILSVGETSGADALAGFFGTLKAWVEFSQPSAY